MVWLMASSLEISMTIDFTYQIIMHEDIEEFS